jgi:hypothetical protein
VYENRVLRRIFGSKREELAGGWRRLRNGELRNLFASPNIIRVIVRYAGYVARIRYMRNAYKILLGISEGKKPLGRPRLRWKYNINIDFREIGWEGVD